MIIFYVDEPEYKLEYRSRVWSPTENYFSRYSGYIPIQVHFDIGRIHSDTGNNSSIHSDTVNTSRINSDTGTNSRIHSYA